MDWRKYMEEKLVVVLLVIGSIVICLQYGEQVGEIVDGMISLLSPFILAIGLAFILNVPMRYIETRFFVKKGTGKFRRGSRGMSLLLTLLLFVGIILVVIVMIVPELVGTMNSLLLSMSTFSVNIQEWLNVRSLEYPNLEEWIQTLDINWVDLSQGVLGFLRSGASGVLNSTVNVVGSLVVGVVHFAVGLVLAIYILYSKESLSRQAKKVGYSFLKPEKVDGILAVLRLTDGVFSDFLSGQCVEACILGFMFFLTMSIFELPYALLIGVMITVTAMIPIFGAIIGCIIGGFLIAVVNPIEALLFLVLFVILQQIEENFIYPHIVGGSVGLPSLWVLTACTLGGSIMGVLGMVLFIPITSVIYKLFGAWVEVRLQKRGITSNKWE